MAEPLQRVGIIVHPSRQEAMTLAREVQEWLEVRGVEVVFDEATAHKQSLVGFDTEAVPLSSLNFIITLGGDGTILTAARRVASYGIPILGVHLGRFGFIAEVHPDEVYSALERVLQNELAIEERLMIQADIWREGVHVASRFGLNEVMVKSGMSHLVRLKTRLGGAPFATYPADGVVIATPTGSTAYALSAGGPIVTPTLQALLMVPICPHTLNARPLMLPSSEEIEIEIESDAGDMFFAVDGVDPLPLQSSDRICIRRSEHITRLFVVATGNFYRKVQSRYLYGERLNEWGR